MDTEKTLIIDCHGHVASDLVLPPDFFHGWSKNIKRKLGVEENNKYENDRIDEILLGLNDDPQCETMFREFDEAGIAAAILLVVDFGLVFDNLALNIEELHLFHKKLIDQSDRVIIFSGVDPRRGKEGLQLFEKAVRNWGFKGFKLYPPCGYSPSDRRLYPFYEVCAELQLPVLTHIGPTSASLSYQHTLPMDIDQAALDFPQVNFILAHAGIMWYKEAALLAEYRPNVYIDLSGYQTGLNSNHFTESLSWHLNRGLAYKLLFGTDWPIHRIFGSQKKWVDSFLNILDQLGVNKLDREMILHGNISRLMGRQLGQGVEK